MIADAFLIVDKPPGLTSHDIVAIVRAVTGLKKVGHTGTLDPFATGVLPVALGGATRLIQFLDEREKIYDMTVSLGREMDTGDPTGAVVAEAPVPTFSTADVEAVLARFHGPQMQTPPRYSAVKVQGRPLYSYARKGDVVEAQPRPIEVYSLELTSSDPTSLRVLLRCSRGTYARVLASDIGRALGTVAHLSALRRIASGSFRIERAVSLAKLAEAVAGDADWERVLRPSRGGERVVWRPRDEVFKGLGASLIPPVDALAHLPRMNLAQADARRLMLTGSLPGPPPEGTVLLVSGDTVVGVATATTVVPLLTEQVRGRPPVG